MKFSYFAFLFIFPFLKLYAQDYDKNPVSIGEIKKGITDLDFLRAVLLEKGMKFEKRDEYGEYWRVPIDRGTERDQKLFSQIAVQISTFKIGQPLKERNLIFQIRKDLLPKYNELFGVFVLNSFPEKKAVKRIVYKNGSDIPTEEYELYYYSNDSKIKVLIEERDSWISYTFKLMVKD